MTTATSSRSGYATPAQKAALLFGIVFLIVGLAGFIPGVTSNFGTMGFAGYTSGALLLGVFQVSILHNIVHLLFGVVGVLMARSDAGARNFLIVGGVVYAVLWLYGLLVAGQSPANFVPMNSADNWLHFVLAVAMILLVVVLSRGRETARR